MLGLKAQNIIGLMQISWLKRRRRYHTCLYYSRQEGANPWRRVLPDVTSSVARCDQKRWSHESEGIVLAGVGRPLLPRWRRRRPATGVSFSLEWMNHTQLRQDFARQCGQHYKTEVGWLPSKCYFKIQGDTSGWAKPPLDINKTKVPFWPVQVRPRPSQNRTFPLMSTGGLAQPDMSPSITYMNVLWDSSWNQNDDTSC